LHKNSQKYLSGQRMLANDHWLQLTREGKLFADGIAADLFFLKPVEPG